MELGAFTRCLAATALAAFSLSGCGNADRFVSPTGEMPSAASVRSANAKELLYLPDQDRGVVHIVDYQTGSKEGELRDLDPRGECVDAKGDIFVANYGGTVVNEYRHGEVRALRIIKAEGSPIGCSVSPSGDLAIANEHTNTGGGDVLIFKQAKGKPQTYSSSACDHLLAAAFDGAGNLYVETENYSSSTICELPAGGTLMTSVGSDVQLHQPGGIMWDGKHITLTDTDYGSPSESETAIYQMQEAQSGKLLKIGKTLLTKGGCGEDPRVHLPFLVGSTNTPKNRQLANEVVGTSYAYGCTKFSVWKYPNGGAPERTIKIPPIGFEGGQAVSIGPR